MSCWLWYSCRRHRDRLGQRNSNGPRNHEHTELLRQSLDPGTLNDGYGIVPDVIVSLSSYHFACNMFSYCTYFGDTDSLSLRVSLVLTYTSSSRAIYSTK